MEIVWTNKISLRTAAKGTSNMTEDSSVSSLSCSYEASGDEADDEASLAGFLWIKPDTFIGVMRNLPKIWW